MFGRHHRSGMRIKRQHCRPEAVPRRIADRFSQEGLVSNVNTIEIADGYRAWPEVAPRRFNGSKFPHIRPARPIGISKPS